MIAPILTGLGVGLALAGAPGPVQAVLLGESIRGGISRGFRAQVGANLTFAAMLLALALGLSVAAPGGVVLRILKIAGGALLIWLAIDGFRSRNEVIEAPVERRRLPPALRGILAVAVNPGNYLFLATVPSSMLSSASRAGGLSLALLVALALVIGIAIGDGTVVLLGGVGVRRAGTRVTVLVRTGLAALLATLGLALVINGIV